MYLYMEIFKYTHILFLRHLLFFTVKPCFNRSSDFTTYSVSTLDVILYKTFLEKGFFFTS